MFGLRYQWEHLVWSHSDLVWCSLYGPVVVFVDILLEELLYYTITRGASAEKSELVGRLCRQCSDAIVCPPLEPAPRARLGRP